MHTLPLGILKILYILISKKPVVRTGCNDALMPLFVGLRHPLSSPKLANTSPIFTGWHRVRTRCHQPLVSPIPAADQRLKIGLGFPAV
jgi:hypothetical protein